MCRSEGSFPEFILSYCTWILGMELQSPVSATCYVVSKASSFNGPWTQVCLNVSLCVWVLICTQRTTACQGQWLVLLLNALHCLVTNFLPTEEEKPLIVRHYWTFKLCGLVHTANLSTLDDRHCDTEARVGYIHITSYGPVLATQRNPVTATTSIPLHSPKQTRRDVVLKAEWASALRQCRGSWPSALWVGKRRFYCWLHMSCWPHFYHYLND